MSFEGPSKNVYEQAARQRVEIDGEGERLRLNNFEAWVTREVLRLKPLQRIVDIGAGENTQLLQDAVQAGANYMAIDTRRQPLSVLAALGKEAIIGRVDAVMASATDLPLRSESVDVAHARLILAWLRKEGQIKALQEMYRVTRLGGEIIAMDYDWNSFVSTSSTINRFKELAILILGEVGFDAFYGSSAEERMKEALPGTTDIITQQFRRQPGMYYAEIFDKKWPLAFMAHKLAKPDLEQEIEDVFNSLEEQRQAGELKAFSPPGMIVVRGKKEM